MARTVTFARPFVLDGVDGVQAAGAYLVETIEEILDAVLSIGYRRISTLIHLHAKISHPGVTEIETIDPDMLDAVVARDSAATNSPDDRSSDPTSTRRV